jgi:2-polyprenyl-3-methyl-5-hydroxy-6-metoxy-1,4-benzoquinol methylase
MVNNRHAEIVSSMVNEVVTSTHSQDVSQGERFEFGKNWSRFLAHLDDNRIATAEQSLRKMLEIEDLSGKRFLDIGSGSGLFSLAARRLGASVHSFDYDPHSVACTSELKARYFPGDSSWTVEEGSALDAGYLNSLGQFDIVYSWGVLHHTGEMWRALENAHRAVGPGGKLFIAIYNDTGSQSSRWKWIKRTYNQLPGLLRVPFALAVSLPEEAKSILRSLLTLNPGKYVRTWASNKKRGMSKWHDMIDWVGGYPYEVATPEEIFEFYKIRGFTLSKLKCGGVGLGCNEFVFQKD